MVFGCIATVLGILAIWVMLWLAHRKPIDNMETGELQPPHVA